MNSTALRGIALLKKKKWEEAYGVLHEADQQDELDTEGLDALAEAASMCTRIDEEVEVRQRAFKAHLSISNKVAAACCASNIASEAFHFGKISVAKGWIQTAENTLVGEDTCVEHAWIERLKSKIAKKEGNTELSDKLIDQFAQIAEDCGDADAIAMAKVDLAMKGLQSGRVSEAFEQLDEEVARALSGQVSEITTLSIYCNVLDACHIAMDMQRGKEWCSVATQWFDRNNLGALNGICRVRDAQVHRFSGEWDIAEKAIESACEGFQGRAWDLQATACHELGIQKLKRGDLTGAKECFQKVQEFGFDAQPGLSLLMAEQGDFAGAAQAIDAALKDARCGRMLPEHIEPAAVEIFVSAGRTDDAEAACKSLEQKATAFDTAAMCGIAQTARAIVASAGGNHELAVSKLADARTCWQRAEAPYDLARNAVLLAYALRAKGDEPDSALKARLEAARSTFVRLGAIRDVAKVDELFGVGEQHREHAVLMFTDICKSSQLVEALGESAWSKLLQWHDQTVQDTCKMNKGEVIKHTGDGFLLLFQTASSAVNCAQEIQQALDANRKEHGYAPQVRIGIHCGEVERRDGDAFGKTVHKASRIAGLAGPDEIVVSQSILQGCPSALSSDPWSEELRGISKPMVLARIEW